ncbi:MAG TPA: hypothetical protein VGL33_18330, partial [Streptosporangiaceae bacterium]
RGSEGQAAGEQLALGRIGGQCERPLADLLCLRVPAEGDQQGRPQGMELVIPVEVRPVVEM